MNDPNEITYNDGLREKACEQFVRRVRYGLQIKKIDSAGLHAGSPIYVYCSECGVPTETFPEQMIFPSTKQCSQCYGLHQLKWMDSAKKMVKEELF